MKFAIFINDSINSAMNGAMGVKNGRECKKFVKIVP